MASAEASMTPEEKAEMEKEMKGPGGTATPPVDGSATTVPTSASGVPLTSTTPAPTVSSNASPAAATEPKGTFSPSATTASSSLQSHIPPTSSPSPSTSASVPPQRRAKPTPEQRAEAEKLEREKEAARELRIETLSKNLIRRIEPFVRANKPGEKEDPETKKFEEGQRHETEELKMESFGIEVCLELLRTLNRANVIFQPTAYAFHRIRLYRSRFHFPQI